MTADGVTGRWLIAGREDTAVSVCVCCLGPATAKFVDVATGGHIGTTVRCQRCELARAE